MFLKKRNIIFKMKIPKVKDYAALNSFRQIDKISANLAFYRFPPSRSINSIIHEYLRKRLYVQYRLMQSILTFAIFFSLSVNEAFVVKIIIIQIKLCVRMCGCVANAYIYYCLRGRMVSIRCSVCVQFVLLKCKKIIKW